MSPPSSIAHYRITSKLGEGGMGAVYRATDTKLNRDVAIKVLPETFASDPDRMVRFTREAQVLASLNHPNIAAIYGVEERAIVMELVEGTSLAGPMPLDRALPVIHQLIDALEYAHEKGIVHRDLKPANMRLTPDGRLKVLDFGLAKAMSGDPASAAGDPQVSPTLTMRATMAGVIMGTAAYMAPEQARGESVDKRADIWAFGVVVYELLTGRRIFEGPTVSDTLAAVLTKELDLTLLPFQARRMVELCLVRDARQRLRDISGARVALEQPVPVPRSERAGVSDVYRWVAAVAVVVAVAALIGWRRATRNPGEAYRPLVRLTVDAGPDAIPGAGVSGMISPDGSRIVYLTRTSDGTHLATRLLSDSKVTILPGPQGQYYPFFSPDSQWLGFFADNRLYKMSFSAGAAIPLCDAPIGRGGAWGTDGIIVLSNDGTSLVQVSDSGGEPKLLLKAGADEANRWPQFLPDKESILYTSSNLSNGNFDDASLAVLSLKTGQAKVVYRGGYFGRYLPTGHLLFIRGNVLYAVRFDAGALQTKGAPIAMVDDVAGNSAWGNGNFDFSESGTLVYLNGKYDVPMRFSWMESDGKATPLGNISGAVPRLSPDGSRLALALRDDIVVTDINNGGQTRLTFNPAETNAFPIWTADGQHVVFGKLNKSVAGIWWTRADGSGQPHLLLSAAGNSLPGSISPDGRRLVYAQTGAGTNRDIWVLPLELSNPDQPKAGTPERLVATPGADVDPMFSPDGRFLAYSSQEGDHYNIYVRSLSGPGLWQIAGEGGRFPMWSAARKQLFFVTTDAHVMVADYTVSADKFSAGKPRLFMETPIRLTGNWYNYAVAPDGKRVLAAPVPGGNSSLHVTFLLNFFDEVRRRLPGTP